MNPTDQLAEVSQQPTEPTDATFFEKLLASFSGFGFACTAFIFSTCVLVPLTFNVTQQLRLPDWFSASIVFFEIFGLTAIAGIYGVVVTAREFVTRRGV